jgi:hypothetical protein
VAQADPHVTPPGLWSKLMSKSHLASRQVRSELTVP